MKTTHVYATYVASRSEGITNNIDGLCQSLRRRRVEAELAAPNVHLHQLNNRRTHLSKGWAARRLLAKALQDPRVDLIHHHVSIAAMGLFAGWTRPSRKPLLVHVWNALFEPQDVHGNAPRSDLLYHRLFNTSSIARAALANADAIIVSSKFQQYQLEAAGVAPPVHVVPNGVDTQKFRPATSEEREAARKELGATGEPTILYYGHLSAWKGVRHFIDALVPIFQEHPRAQAIIAHTDYGNGEQQLRRLLAKRGLARSVILTGPSHVPTLLAAADLAVVPAMAPVGTACHPNVLLEILASGVPAVASRIGSIPELVRETVTGYLTRPGDAEDIAAHLSLLADDESLRRRVGAQARMDMVENYDWDVVAERVHDLYMRYLDDAPSALATPSLESVAREAEPIPA